MSKFLDEGVKRQQEAMNEFQARVQFNRSCRICCEKGYNWICDIDCRKNCPIAYAHKITMGAFEERRLNQIERDRDKRRAG